VLTTVSFVVKDCHRGKKGFHRGESSSHKAYNVPEAGGFLSGPATKKNPAVRQDFLVE
jgi:hypothetical protein